MSAMEATMADEPVWYQVTGSTARPIRDARFRRAVIESRRLARALLAWRGLSLTLGRGTTLAQRECARRRHTLAVADCEGALMVASADDSARESY